MKALTGIQVLAVLSSALRLETTWNTEDVSQVGDALAKIGVSLNITKDNHIVSTNIRRPLPGYIRRLAELRAKKK